MSENNNLTENHQKSYTEEMEKIEKSILKIFLSRDLKVDVDEENLEKIYEMFKKYKEVCKNKNV